ncbi:hypothetical protein ZOSMA_196G00330 [Zostera marina]|uniref:ATPase inhibitor n=1 Tax=Zostera marina TaxID=29655 RepID=A0A0K9PP13_ZOSMR|nr:hypothetical protein ZOSMA_196G00330 [Zostera marina]
MSAVRSTFFKVPRPVSLVAGRSGFRKMSEFKGKILSEEERAVENVYIQKMEREKMEKAKLKAEKEKNMVAAALKNRVKSSTGKGEEAQN